MGPLGALLGNLQGQQGLGYFGIQQQAWIPAVTAGTNTNVNSWIVDARPVEAVPVKPKGAETALEWLDRRVNEVRLSLAAGLPG